jgi:hypothetical protein
MTQSPMASDGPVATIEGTKGTAEIYEKVVETIIEYTVKFGEQTKVFNNLGEAYIEAGELAGAS